MCVVLQPSEDDSSHQRKVELSTIRNALECSGSKDTDAPGYKHTVRACHFAGSDLENRQ